ncbi:branched-chain amino acid ABC transporter permease [Faunimonas sp. B44]|uniref:branched-chain amino acid ABC transporter permease n=1 Tax=Faunimonas sp. B44 TaxID=3461493 RepID=UPI004043BFB1
MSEAGAAGAEAGAVPAGKRPAIVGTVAVAAVLLLLALLPLAASDYVLVLGTEILILALFAVGTNLLLGFMGYVSLGQAAYFGFGAYGLAALTLLFDWATLPAMLVTLAGSVVFAIVLGLFCLRTSGVRFLLITLAFSQMFYAVLVRTPQTGGDDGIVGIPRPDLEALGIDLWGTPEFYYYVLAVVVVTLWLLHRFVRSPFGSVVIAIRENEPRARALGYDVGIYKLACFVLAGLVAAIAGMLQAQNLSFASPELASWRISAEVLLMIIIGGWRSFLGPAIGALAFIAIREGLAIVTEHYLLFFGLFFMAAVALFREGVAGGVDALGRLGRRR